jgi:hypothetical protein
MTLLRINKFGHFLNDKFLDQIKIGGSKLLTIILN